MPTQAYDCRILVDSLDLSGQSNQFALKIDAQAIDYQVFQQSAKQRLPTDPAATLDHSGYWEGPGAGNLEKEIYDRLGANGTGQIAAILGASAAAPVCYVFPNAYSATLDLQAQTAQLLTVAGQWVVESGAFFRGQQLYTGPINATGAQGGQDFGALGTNGGRAWLWVHSIAGTATNATIAVQSDDNAGFGSPTARGTFTFSTAGARAFEIALSAVERYLRINTTSLGGATSFTVSVIAGVAGISY